MSQIKSTLDLIMEKTRHLSMKPEELAELETVETLKKARGMLSLYLKGEKDIRALSRDLKPLPAEHAEAVRGACLRELAEHLSLTGDNARIFSAVEVLESRSAAQDWERASRKSASELAPSCDRQKAEALERFRTRLADEGVSGSAVVPATERNPFLREIEATFDRRFREAVTASLGIS